MIPDDRNTQLKNAFRNIQTHMGEGLLICQGPPTIEVSRDQLTDPNLLMIRIVTRRPIAGLAIEARDSFLRLSPGLL